LLFVVCRGRCWRACSPHSLHTATRLTKASVYCRRAARESKQRCAASTTHNHLHKAAVVARRSALRLAASCWSRHLHASSSCRSDQRHQVGPPPAQQSARRRNGFFCARVCSALLLQF
jgi:hypothetical protein